MFFKAIMLATAFLTVPVIAFADPADEARRQAQMQSSRDSAAAIDRRNADQAFQQGLARSSSSAPNSGSPSGSSGSGSSSPLPGGRTNDSAYSGGPAAEGYNAATGQITVNVSGGGGVAAARAAIATLSSPTLAQIAQRLSREAAAGNAQSQYQLGRMNAAGYGVSENMTEARRLFVAAASQGHVEASAYAGQFLVYGKGGPVDMARGMSYAETAAKAGNIDAKSMLGVRYMTTAFETGNNADMPRAIQFLEQAALGGNAIAQATLGTTVYYYGVGGVPADGVKAVRYLRMGAEQGEPMSMYYLGNLMVNGDPWTGENRNEGWSLVTRSSQAGNGRAMWLLGAAKFNGSRGQQKDEAAGMRLIRQSAETGDRNGQHTWGLMLYAGMGQAENKREGLRYIRLAADQSFPDALTFIGKSYYFGDEGMVKNLTEAARWARLAAESGDMEGQAFYSKLLWAGEGVAQDRVQAVRWLKKAADQGDEASVNDLKDPEVAAILRTLSR